MAAPSSESLAATALELLHRGQPRAAEEALARLHSQLLLAQVRAEPPLPALLERLQAALDLALRTAEDQQRSVAEELDRAGLTRRARLAYRR